MADNMFDLQVPGLSRYLQMKQALINSQTAEQNQGLQQEFIQRRRALGDNPSPETLTGLASQYASPHELMQYGQAHLDRREATAQRLQQSHELAQYRLDNLQRMKEADLARVKNEEGRQALTDYYKNAELQLKQYQADTASELKKLGLDIAQQNADTNRMRAEQTVNKNDEPLQTMLDKIDATTRMIQQNPEAVGGRGMVGRGMEFLGSLTSPGTPTPASDLQSQILDLQTTYRGLPGHAASRLKIDAANIDKLIKGLGTFTTADQALGSLNTLRDTISRQLQRRGGEAPSAESPAPAPSGFSPAPSDPKARKSGTVYLTPRGPLKWTGTGWIPNDAGTQR